MAGYGTDADFVSWAAANGYADVIKNSTLSIPVMRQRGSSYVDNHYGLRFSGLPVGGLNQERAWPRAGASAFGVDVSASVVPLAVVYASYLAAIQEAVTPGSLSVFMSTSNNVKSKRVGDIAKEFFEPKAGASLSPVLSEVEGLLFNFFGNLVPGVFTT